MGWSDFVTRVGSTQPNVSKTQYYNDMADIVTKITAIQSKLDTIEANATADQTGVEIVSAINSSVGMINFVRLTMADGDVTIAKVNGLQTALDAKALSAHTHLQVDVTDLVDDLLNKSELSHTHSMSDVTLLSDEFDTKSNTNHQHDHGDCIDNDSGLDNDHPDLLSRKYTGVAESNLLETQLTYKTGVVPIAMNDVPRILDVLNFMTSGIADSDSGFLDATGQVAVPHGLSTTSFIMGFQIKTGLTWEKYVPTVIFDDDDNFTIHFGTGYSTTDEYKYSYIAMDNLSGATGIPVGLIPGQKTGILTTTGIIDVSHHIASDYIKVSFMIDEGTPTVPDWTEYHPTVKYRADGLGFTAYLGSGLKDMKFKAYWIKKLV